MCVCPPPEFVLTKRESDFDTPGGDDYDGWWFDDGVRKNGGGGGKTCCFGGENNDDDDGRRVRGVFGGTRGRIETFPGA